MEFLSVIQLQQLSILFNKARNKGYWLNIDIAPNRFNYKLKDKAGNEVINGSVWEDEQLSKDVVNTIIKRIELELEVE